MSYRDTFGEIRLVAAIEGHKKWKELVPSQTEFRNSPSPQKSILLQDLSTHMKQFRQPEGGSAYLGNGIPLHAKQAQKGGRGKPLHPLDPRARMWWVVSDLLRPL